MEKLIDGSLTAKMERSDFKNEDDYIYRGDGNLVNCKSHFRTSSSKWIEVYIEGHFDKILDDCFSSPKVKYVRMRGGSYIHLGNKCFLSSKLEEITLPETLESIGHNNFSGLITSFNIPSRIKDFPVDNLINCHKLQTITISDGNTAYKVVDDVLYNYDLTIALFCPNAKEGIVIIPNTVKHIGEYCFYGCKCLKDIYIPASVESIGKFAFYKASLNKLIIPNSVKVIGNGCFKKFTIKDFLHLSSQINVLPDKSFQESNINRLIFSYKNITNIGSEAISNISKDIIPKSVSFESLKQLGNSALNYCNETDIFEFFSCLEEIDTDALTNTKDSVQIRYFSYCPIRLNVNAFRDIPENATLIVPPGSAIIFRNAIPWSTIPNIQESSLGMDINENNEEIITSDEKHISRIRSVAQSKIKADRDYLKDILEELYLSYLYVDSDEEYQEALDILKYNRNFSPTIIPDLEQKMCQNWTIKYKLKIVSNILLNNSANVLTYTHDEHKNLQTKKEIIPLPTIDVCTDLPKPSIANVQVFFDGAILKELQHLLTLTKHNLKIAVSWFTNYSLFKQIKDLATSGIKVQLITNNDLTNNGGYCLNLNELIFAGVEINLIEYPHLLHHKFCIIDEEIAINGSYNWTRFSAKNYENIMVIKNDPNIIDAFTIEFNYLLQNAEYKNISEMPEFVPERPEYDRSAFRQYVTEELDAEARETSEERDKITILQKAVSLNSEYLEKINPQSKKKYAEAFKTVTDSVTMQKNIVAMVEDKPKKMSSTSTKLNAPCKKDESSLTPNNTTCSTKTKSEAIITREEQSIIKKVKATGLLMVLDVSGSMDKTYREGHVHNISKMALAASLAITDSKKVSLWTFGKDAKFIDNIGIDTSSKINQIKCKKESTHLKAFIDTADTSIEDYALVIIFTDDDANSIAAAIPKMQKRKNVFWQIIVYGNSHENINQSISNVSNTSVVNLTNYASKSEEQISQILLHDYICWKKNHY